MSVTYRKITEDKITDHSNVACFSSFGYDKVSPDRTEYDAVINNTLTIEEVNFYIKFLTRLFRYENLSHTLDWDNKIIKWTFNSKDMPVRKTVLILTGMRVTDEYYNLIGKLYLNRKEENGDLKKLSVLFKEFQEIHKKSGCGGGHSFIYDYMMQSPNYVPITLKEFRDNLLNLKVANSSFDYFKKPAVITKV